MSYTDNSTIPSSNTNHATTPGPMSPNSDRTTVPSSSTRSSTGMCGDSSAGATTGSKIEGIMSSIHGAGEQVRGQFNMAVDAAIRDREGQERNRGIIERGREEVATGRVIENPEKRRHTYGTYPAGAGTTTGITGTESVSGVGGGSLTENSYGAPGPTNAHKSPGPGHTGGGQAVGGGFYVADETRRSSAGY